MKLPEVLPRFATEAEEALWWFQQRDRLTAEAEAAVAEGKITVRRLASPAPNPAAQDITIPLAAPDLARAHELAARRGLGYQTYLKILLHEALENEAKHLAT